VVHVTYCNYRGAAYYSLIILYTATNDHTNYCKGGGIKDGLEVVVFLAQNSVLGSVNLKILMAQFSVLAKCYCTGILRVADKKYHNVPKKLDENIRHTLDVCTV
jgi:hypothetical protein